MVTSLICGYSEVQEPTPKKSNFYDNIGPFPVKVQMSPMVKIYRPLKVIKKHAAETSTCIVESTDIWRGIVYDC